jgi:hypothetical protein
MHVIIHRPLVRPSDGNILTHLGQSQRIEF